MSEKNKDLIRRWYSEVWNNGDDTVIDKLLHPESRAFGLGDEPLVGPSGFGPFHAAFNKDYSGIHVNIDKIFAEGDYVIALCTVNAIHRATNKPVKFTGTSIGHIVDGQIKDAWNNFNFLAMHLQTGKIKHEQLV